MRTKKDSESIVRDIKRKTRKKYNAEEKIRIVLDGLRGEESIATIYAVKGSTLTCVTNGVKTFLRPGKSGCREICSVKPHAAR